MNTLRIKYVRSPQPELFLAVRKQLKCNKSQLARLIRVNRSTITRIEKGEICPDILLIRRLLNLRNRVGQVRSLPDLPEVRQLEQRMQQQLTVADLDSEDLKRLYLAHSDKLEELERQLHSLQAKLDSALAHSALDDWSLEQLENELGALKVCDRESRELELSESTQVHFAEAVEKCERAHRRKDAWAIELLPSDEMEMRQEMELLERQLAKRREMLAEIELLLEAAETQPAEVNELAEPLSTESGVAQAEHPQLDQGIDRESGREPAPLENLLREKIPRNINSGKKRKRCVEKSGATLELPDEVQQLLIGPDGLLVRTGIVASKEEALALGHKKIPPKPPEGFPFL